MTPRYSEGDRVSVRDGLGTRSSLGTVAEDWPGTGPVAVRYDGKTKARPIDAKRVQPITARSISISAARKVPSRVVRAPATELPPVRPVPRSLPPQRSAVYLAFVRERPCQYCRSTERVEAHHWQQTRAIGRKADDYRAIALCDECHEHFHRHGTLERMDARTTREFFLLKQVDLLIEWIARSAER